MRNGPVSDAPISFNGARISESFSYEYLGREVNKANILVPELGRKEQRIEELSRASKKS